MKYYGQPENKKVTWIVGGIIFLFAIFVYTRFDQIWRGVPIKVISIKNGESVPPIITLLGSADNAKEFKINEKIIPIDSNGNFKDTITLPSGYSVVTLSAKDKFGNTTEKTYKLFVRDDARGPTLGSNTIISNIQ